MFFKLGNSFEYVAPALVQVRRADVLFKETVSRILAAETLNNFLACPGILVIAGKNGFKNVNGNIPVRVFLVVHIDFLHEHGTAVVADVLGNLALNMIEKIDFFRNEGHKMGPYFLDRIGLMTVYVPIERFFIVFDRVLDVAVSFVFFREQFCDVRFFIVDFYQAFPDFIHGIVVLGLVGVGKGAQGVL